MPGSFQQALVWRENLWYLGGKPFAGYICCRVSAGTRAARFSCELRVEENTIAEISWPSRSSAAMAAIRELALLLLPFFCLVHRAAGSKDGVVGFGISLYEDLCCQACHDSLSTLYLSCTTFDHDMSEMGEMADMEGMDMMVGVTSEECQANNTAWLETMAYCIQQNCNADGYPAEKQAECFSVQALGGASTPTFQDSLPATPPTVELAANATWLNETSLVNSELYYSTHGTLGEFAREEYLHTKYSYVHFLIIARHVPPTPARTDKRPPGWPSILLSLASSSPAASLSRLRVGSQSFRSSSKPRLSGRGFAISSFSLRSSGRGGSNHFLDSWVTCRAEQSAFSLASSSS